MCVCVSSSFRTVFQLFNTRLSRGGKVEDCSGPICKKNTICMLRSMRSESNCVSTPSLSLFSLSLSLSISIPSPPFFSTDLRFASVRVFFFFRKKKKAVIQPGLSFKDQKRDTDVRDFIPFSLSPLLLLLITRSFRRRRRPNPPLEILSKDPSPPRSSS